MCIYIIIYSCFSSQYEIFFEKYLEILYSHNVHNSSLGFKMTQILYIFFSNKFMEFKSLLNLCYTLG